VIDFSGAFEQYVWLLDCSTFNDAGDHKWEIQFLSFWKCEVFLAQYLSVHTDLFHFLQGKGEFTMEYKEHSPVSHDVQMQLVNTYKASKTAE
jgi:hypothetical protein